MRLLRNLCLSLTLFVAPLGAKAQGTGDIIIDSPETLEFEVRTAITPGTQQVYCYQQSQLRVVGSVNTSGGSTATIPVALPDPVIRCAACNAWGCSSLSTNSVVVVAADRLDFDLNTVVDVRDMLMCISEVQDRIY
jgi:hypothetical protein